MVGIPNPGPFRPGFNSAEGRETLRTIVTAVLALAVVIGAFVHVVWFDGGSDSPFVAWGALALGFWFGARAGSGMPATHATTPPPGVPARRATDRAPSGGGVL